MILDVRVDDPGVYQLIISAALVNPGPYCKHSLSRHKYSTPLICQICCFMEVYHKSFVIILHFSFICITNNHRVQCIDRYSIWTQWNFTELWWCYDINNFEGYDMDWKYLQFEKWWMIAFATFCWSMITVKNIGVNVQQWVCWTKNVFLCSVSYLEVYSWACYINWSNISLHQI